MCNWNLWMRRTEPVVEIRVITKKYFAHVPTDCRCPLKIHRHSYFPEAASAGLRFIKSSGDAKNSHLLKFHWRFQAGRQLKGQFAEAGEFPSLYSVRLLSLGFFFKYDYLPRASRFRATRGNQFLRPIRWTLSKNCAQRFLSGRRSRHGTKRKLSEWELDETPALRAYGKVDGRIKDATGWKLQKLFLFHRPARAINDIAAGASVVAVMGKELHGELKESSGRLAVSHSLLC